MHMPQLIDIEEFVKLDDKAVILDVRSPAEFAKAHISHAINLPLFSDEERATVGTLYKQVDPDTAFLKGLEFAGAKMRSYVEQARINAPENKIILHCWRGGQRSASMAWLLEKAGFQVQVLKGGYKAYRQYLHAYFENGTYQLRVLGGPTGSGKTLILNELQQLGEFVLDLENIACHKGSSFGALGNAPQPSVEQFENILFNNLSKFPQDQLIWVENESKGIGRIFLPTPFYIRLRNAPMIQLEMPIEWRIENLIEEYGQFSQKELEDAFVRIQKRLGGQHLQKALAALKEDDLDTAARIALVYYDKTYFYGIDNKHKADINKISAIDRNPSKIAQQVRNFVAVTT